MNYGLSRRLEPSFLMAARGVAKAIWSCLTQSLTASSSRIGQVGVALEIKLKLLSPLVPLICGNHLIKCPFYGRADATRILNLTEMGPCCAPNKGVSHSLHSTEV